MFFDVIYCWSCVCKFWIKIEEEMLKVINYSNLCMHKILFHYFLIINSVCFLWRCTLPCRFTYLYFRVHRRTYVILHWFVTDALIIRSTAFIICAHTISKLASYVPMRSIIDVQVTDWQTEQTIGRCSLPAVTWKFPG